MFTTDGHKVYLWNSDSLKNPTHCVWWWLGYTLVSHHGKQFIYAFVAFIDLINPLGPLEGRTRAVSQSGSWLSLLRYLPGHAGQMFVPGASHPLPCYSTEVEKFRTSRRLHHEHCTSLWPCLSIFPLRCADLGVLFQGEYSCTPDACLEWLGYGWNRVIWS